MSASARLLLESLEVSKKVTVSESVVTGIAFQPDHLTRRGFAHHRFDNGVLRWSPPGCRAWTLTTEDSLRERASNYER